MRRNIDVKTVSAFGEEWNYFDQSTLTQVEQLKMFNSYFAIFPWDSLPEEPEGFDFGCGSGRWASIVAPRVGLLHCIDASEKALSVTKKKLSDMLNIKYHLTDNDELPLHRHSQDFGYALGVLHHIPDTRSALRECVMTLKPGAPFLVYLYYAFDNRSMLYRVIWKLSDAVRRLVCWLPETLRRNITDAIALVVYYPLARFSALLNMIGINTGFIPLSYYKNLSYYTMRTDSRDRFGTRLEQRFTRDQIVEMMTTVGLERIRISDMPPYWCAVGIRK